jgi:glutamine synthetase
VGEGTIDTVVLAFTDMQGRLQGKRLSAEFFLEEVVHHHAEGCNYLLAVDVEMNTVDGYRDVLVGARVRGLRLVPALATLRRMPGTRRPPGHRRPAWTDGAGGRLAPADPPGPD